MPLYPTSFFLPPASVPFLIEDKYVRGGFMTVPNAAARDAMHVALRKKYMIVITQDDGLMWTIGASTSVWLPVNLAYNVKFGEEFTIDNDGNVILANAASATPGQVLTVTAEGKTVWATAPGASAGTLPDESTGTDGSVLTIVGGVWAAATPAPPVPLPEASSGDEGDILKIVNGVWETAENPIYAPLRTTHNQVAPAIAAAAQYDFVVPMGKTCFVLELSVSHVNLRVEAHSTAARNDTNPYTFISSTGRLTDDGSTVMVDLTVIYGRRYAIVSNADATLSNNIYWRIKNVGSVSVTPTVNMKYLTIEF